MFFLKPLSRARWASLNCAGFALLGVLLTTSAGRGEPPAALPPPGPWQIAEGPWLWSFPRDHGAHPSFKSEWWYFTGNVHDARGRRFGYQLTLFRQGIQFKPM